jgi:hypothetical protein
LPIEVKLKMDFRIVLARIYEWAAFVSFWKMVGLVFRSVAHPTSKQEIVPFKGKVGPALYSALGSKMFDMPVLDMSNLALTVRALPVEHTDQRLLNFAVPIFRLCSHAFRLGACG